MKSAEIYFLKLWFEYEIIREVTYCVCIINIHHYC